MTAIKNFSIFEEKIGTKFNNAQLLEQAFTHRSYINENKKSRLGHNERLEFLGDAVLELVVTEYLYEKFPKETEGDLTAYRSALVNANTLGDLARELGMEEFLLLSKGESKDTGRARQYILANTIEALVGALFLDQGYPEAKRFISEYLFPLTERIVKEKLWLDAKSNFQEKAQELTGITPLYKKIDEIGPDHDKHFTVAVFLGEKNIAEGSGKSKQDAEQEAARNALTAQGWL